MSKWTKKVSEIVYDSGKAYYTCNATVYGMTDEGYGADADGNRGYPKDFIEDVELDNVDISYYDEDGEETGTRSDVNPNELPEEVYRGLEEIAIDTEGEIYD